MSTDAISRIEKLHGRKLSEEEAARLRATGDELNLRDDDAVWSLLAALEYQRVFYEALPEKIAGASAEILQGITVAAEREVAYAQSRLADSVVEQAKKLSLKTHVHTWILWGIFALVLLLLYGSLLLWAGYSIGSGQAQPPALLLRMPVGIIIGVLCFCCGIFSGVWAAREFAEAGAACAGNAVWRGHMLIALAFLSSGGWIFSLAVR